MQSNPTSSSPVYLPRSLHVFNTQPEHFQQVLKQELQVLPISSLPLQRGVTQAGYVDEQSPISVTVFNGELKDSVIHCKLGVFFTEIVINCGCGDDPMHINSYCDMLVRIHRDSGLAEFSILHD